MSASDDPREQPDARSRITEAAARLLRDGGAAAVTTRAVARAADVPPPTIFRVFGDKDGLLHAVAEHVLASYVTASAEQSAHDGSDPVAALRAAWHDHVEFGLANPDLYVLLSSPGRIERSPATAQGAGVLAARVGRVAAAGLLKVTEPRAVGLIHAAGTGVVIAVLNQAPEARDPSLSDTMLDSVLRTILTTSPAPPASEVTPLAIAFRTVVPALPALTAAERTLMTEWVDRTLDRLP